MPLLYCCLYSIFEESLGQYIQNRTVSIPDKISVHYTGSKRQEHRLAFAYLKYARIHTMLAKNLWDLTINYNSLHLWENIRSDSAMVTGRYRPSKEIEKGEKERSGETKSDSATNPTDEGGDGQENRSECEWNSTGGCVECFWSLYFAIVEGISGGNNAALLATKYRRRDSFSRWKLDVFWDKLFRYFRCGNFGDQQFFCMDKNLFFSHRNYF